MNEIKIEDFFNTDYVDSASYDNIRSIASLIDGLKNCNRKILHTMISKNINSKSKISRLQSTISEYTEYLHGEDGIGKVIVGMAQNYSGSNNIPLLQRNGNFGNRLDHVSGASRYIYTQKEKYLTDLFIPKDYNILTTQFFEGIKIEPRFFVPIIPMLCVNGSHGISTGFAQKILPRSPEVIISEIKDIIKGNKKLEDVDLKMPYWNGFTGLVVRDEEILNKWYVYGNIIVENKNNLIVDELPIGYDLKKYISVLEDLVEKNIIVSYKDLSDNDRFNFSIRVKREFSKYNIEQMYIKLKLKISITENYTCIDIDNRIKVFNNIEEIFIDYFKIRMDYYKLRKINVISEMKKDLGFLNSKYLFIKKVISGDIIINNRTKKNIIEQISLYPKIILVDNEYSYLLRQPLYSLTKEKLSDIKLMIKNIKEELKLLMSKSLEDMWLSDLSKIKLEQLL